MQTLLGQSNDPAVAGVTGIGAEPSDTSLGVQGLGHTGVQGEGFGVGVRGVVNGSPPESSVGVKGEVGPSFTGPGGEPITKNIGVQGISQSVLGSGVEAINDKGIGISARGIIAGSFQGKVEVTGDLE